MWKVEGYISEGEGDFGSALFLLHCSRGEERRERARIEMDKKSFEK
jgi:hypothetical protein